MTKDIKLQNFNYKFLMRCGYNAKCNNALCNKLRIFHRDLNYIVYMIRIR